MKLVSFLLGLWCCLAFQTKAQTHLRVDIGASVPRGKYAKIDPSDKQSGFADRAYFTQLTLDLFPQALLTPFARLTFNYNPYRDQTKSQFYSSLFVASSSKSYTQQSFGIGGLLKTKGKRVSLFSELSLGVAAIQSAEYLLINQQTGAYQIVESKEAYNPSFSFGVGLQFHLSTFLHLNLGSAYWFSPGEYDNSLTSPIEILQVYTGVSIPLGSE